MKIQEAPQLIELAKLLAEKNGITTQEVLTAIQITVLASLTEIIARKEFNCGESY